MKTAWKIPAVRCTLYALGFLAYHYNFHPAVFLFSGKRYRCKICPASRWQSATQAAKHEDVIAHIVRVCELDGRTAAMSSDSFGGPNMAEHVVWTSKKPCTAPNHQLSPLPPSSPPSDHVPSQSSPTSLAHETKPGLNDGDSEDETASDSLVDPYTIHGPALLSDDANLIYDNWGGNIACKKASMTALSLKDDKPGGPNLEVFIDPWLDLDALDHSDPLTVDPGFDELAGKSSLVVLMQCQLTFPFIQNIFLLTAFSCLTKTCGSRGKTKRYVSITLNILKYDSNLLEKNSIAC